MWKLQAQSEIPIFNVVLKDKSQVFDWNYYNLINHSIELIMLKLQTCSYIVMVLLSLMSTTFIFYDLNWIESVKKVGIYF